jgi:hypothetical protein
MSKLENCSGSRISVADYLRYEGSASMYRALMRNVRTCRHDAKGERQVSGPHKTERTDAWHTGGATCIVRQEKLMVDQRVRVPPS